MTKEEIMHLGTLSRVALTEQEITNFAQEIDAIVEYVSELQSIVNESGAMSPDVGVRHNIFREDVITNEPGSYTKAIVAQFPRAVGDYLEVPKIIAQKD